MNQERGPPERRGLFKFLPEWYDALNTLREEPMIAALLMGIIAYLAYPPEIWSIHFTKYSMGQWLRILATIVFSLLAVSVFVSKLTKRF